MSTGRFSDFQIERWLASLADSGCYLALHYDNPDVAGAYASEVFGGTYARTFADFTGVEGRTVWNTAAVKWSGLPAVVVTHVAGWDAANNGNLLWSSSLDSVVRIAQGNGFSLGARVIGLSVN
jgi:hypothetical protein